MPRTVINRSVSFDPQVFEKMEERRKKLMMERSDYVRRCIMADMVKGGEMKIEEVPELYRNQVTLTSRNAPRKKPSVKRDR